MTKLLHTALTSQATAGVRTTGTVMGRYGVTGQWLVRTTAGRLVRVAGSGSWPVGARVALIGEQIVSAAGNPPATKTYQV